MTRGSGVRSVRTVSLTHLLLLASLLPGAAAGLLWSAPAHAECVQTGSDVTCTGVDSDGFPNSPGDRPPADDGLDISVESGAVVENFVGAAGATASIAVNEDNRVTVAQGGTVTASSGGTAIRAFDSTGSNQNTLTNAGVVLATGSGGTGIEAGTSANVTNTATGRITASAGIGGSSTTGIRVGANGVVQNDGVVDVTGANSVGIDASQTGASVDSGGDVFVSGFSAVGIDGQSITHAGTTRVTGTDATGLRTDSTATNSGSVEVTGDGGVGIDASSGTVTNTAGVEVSGDDSLGIRVGANGVVANDGVVDVTGAGSVGIDATEIGASVDSGGDVFASGLSAVGIDGESITHAGTTRVTGTDATGLRTDSTATNSGSVEVTGDGGVGIDVISGSVTNSGDVTVSGVDATGVSLDTGGRLDNTGDIDAFANDGGVGVMLRGRGAVAENTGTIRGGSGTGAAVVFGDTAGAKGFLNGSGGRLEAASGIAVVGGLANDEVLNLGDITGDVVLGAGDDLFIWRGGSSVSGLIDGGSNSGNGDSFRLSQGDPANPADESFDLGSSLNFERLLIGPTGVGGSWTLTGSGDYSDGIFATGGEVRIDPSVSTPATVSLSGGVLHLENGVSLPGGVVATGGRTELPATASVSANLDVSNGAELMLEDDASVTGDLTLQDAALEIPFTSTGSAGELTLSGSADLGSTSELVMRQQDSGLLTADITVRVLTAGTRTGEFAEIRILDSRTPFLVGTASYDLQSVYVTIDPLEPDFLTQNERSVFQYLGEAINEGVSSEFQEFLDSFQGLTADETAGALDALHGAAYDAQTSAALATATHYVEMLARRALRCERLVSPYRRDRPSLAACSPRGLSPWVESFGLFRDRDGRSEYDDWSSAGGGIAFGLDGELGKGFTLSGLLGTSRSGLDLDDDGDGSYTSFELGLGVGFRHGNTHARAAFGYGHGWHDTHRDIRYTGFSRLSLSDYDSDRVSLFAEVGHTFVLAPFEIEPLASVEYTWLEQESFNETNAGVANLAVDSRTSHSVATNTGLRAGMTLVKYAFMGDWLEWADGVWRPEIRASWRQVWNDYNRDFDARMQGAPADVAKFEANAQDAQYGGRLGAGVSFQPYGTRNTIEIGYDAFLGDRTSSHAVKAVFRMPL